MVSDILRLLPNFKGKQRLSRLLLNHKVFENSELHVNGRFACNYLIPNIRETIGFELFINGIYEPHVIQFIVDRLPESGFFLDIGANIGAISIPVFKRRNDVNIGCVEASKNVFNYLQKNMHRNNVRSSFLLQNAVNDRDGKILEFFSPDYLFGKGSFSNLFSSVKEEVETVSIDALVKMYELKLDFIKIDIEGYEYYAFKGGQSCLSSSNAPDILFEFVDWAEKNASGLKPGFAQDLLLDYGYSLYAFDKKKILSPLLKPVRQGATLIFATKNK